ncbi:hypothetical protein TYRP_003945 [Tyrophagus putrescentiae]|nr:hypothetical protein TYRP_003945 [Tyrophagus putrescentiae]
MATELTQATTAKRRWYAFIFRFRLLLLRRLVLAQTVGAVEGDARADDGGEGGVLLLLMLPSQLLHSSRLLCGLLRGEVLRQQQFLLKLAAPIP